MSITVLGKTSVTGSFATSGASNTARLSSAAKEFESVLLGQWLKDAEASFGSVPGSEENDAGGDQMKEFAMQHVAADIVERGGIGIAALVESALAKQETPQNIPSEGVGR
jgi:Rod binding domain-containing protein